MATDIEDGPVDQHAEPTSAKPVATVTLLHNLQQFITPTPQADRSLSARLEAEHERLWQVNAIVELAENFLATFDPDWEADKIVDEMTTPKCALQGAKALLAEINNALYRIAQEAKSVQVEA